MFLCIVHTQVLLIYGQRLYPYLCVYSFYDYSLTKIRQYKILAKYDLSYAILVYLDYKSICILTVCDVLTFQALLLARSYL